MLGFLSISPEQRPCAAVLPLISTLDSPSLIISVFMLSEHQPGMSLAPPAAGQSTPALTGAAKGDQLENRSLDQAPLLQGQGSPVHVRLWLWGGCIPSGHVWGAQDGLVQTLAQSRPPWAGLDSPGHSRGFLQRLRDRSGTLTKALVEMNKGVCREGFICQCKKANAQIPPLKCMTGRLRMAPNWMPRFSVLTTQRYLVRAKKADF